MAVVTIALTILLLIAINALYVAGEFGAVTVSRARIRALAEDGHAGARRLGPIVDSPKQLDRYIAGCQIGITLSSLLLGAYGQQALVPVLERVFGDLAGWEQAAAHTAALAIVLASLTVAQMVLGELVPKAMALQFPDRTAMMTARPISWSLRLLAPLIWFFNGSGLAVLRILGVAGATERHVHSLAEIDLLLSEGGDGALEPTARRRLRRALRLSSRRARDLMIPREQIVAIESGTTLEDAARIGSEQPYTRFPVYRGDLDHAVGLLHTKDVVRAQMRGKQGVIDDLLRPVVHVPLEASADQILVSMREQRVSQALVVDERAHVVGMVALRDVLTDLFGALADEFKSGSGAGSRPGHPRVR
ncbi:MAG TPA: hemolysin family protein [Kofleriaceae bacterium]|nr:hemolysin family protein [Kofleriaceae bacterium]